MPQDATVSVLFDGELRLDVNVVYESKGGEVVISDYDMVCYSTDSRPKDAPTEDEDRYWSTESDKTNLMDL